MGDVINMKPSDNPHREMDRQEPPPPKSPLEELRNSAMTHLETLAASEIAAFMRTAKNASDLGQMSGAWSFNNEVSALRSTSKDIVVAKIIAGLQDRGIGVQISGGGLELDWAPTPSTKKFPLGRVAYLLFNHFLVIINGLGLLITGNVGFMAGISIASSILFYQAITRKP